MKSLLRVVGPLATIDQSHLVQVVCVYIYIFIFSITLKLADKLTFNLKANIFDRGEHRCITVFLSHYSAFPHITLNNHTTELFSKQLVQTAKPTQVRT